MKIANNRKNVDEITKRPQKCYFQKFSFEAGGTIDRDLSEERSCQKFYFRSNWTKWVK